MIGGSFFRELRQRKVVQVAAFYGAAAWGLTEVVVTIAEQLFLPQWVSTLTVIGFVVGFPIAMFLAWTFDITPEGIKRTEIGSRRGKASIVLSLLLLVAGTAGLFFLIRPSLEQHEAATAAAEILPNSVAVLPFENAGLDPGDAYLGDGLSDELRDQLGRMIGIRVAARSSSRFAVTQQLGALETAAKLGVANIVEGSVRRRGGKLRISVQLVEGASGLALWSEVFDSEERDLLRVQQAIAEQVVAKVLPGTAEIAPPATRSVSANDAMLLARYEEQQVRDQQIVDFDRLDRAIALYRQATEADPDSALAHSRLAGALLYRGDVDAAEAPIFRALSLDPNLSEVQNTLGEFYWARGRPEAGAAFARAVELNPNNADALHNYANMTWLTLPGFESGVDPAPLFRRAQELDPLSLSRYAALGDYLGKQEVQIEEVREVIAEIEALFDGAESYRVIAWLYELIGEVDRAIGWTIRARDLEPGNPDHVAKLAELYAILGDAETALRLEPEPGIGLLFHLRRYDELIDLAEFQMIEEPEDMLVRYLLAFAYVATDRFESAVHVLGSAGLLDLATTEQPRSVAEIEASFTLNNAVAGLGSAEGDELAQSLASWNLEHPWWGEIGWIALNRSCVLAILGRYDEALRQLAAIGQSPRLRNAPVLRDSWCFRPFAEDPAYLEILDEQERRRAALRQRLPVTLAEMGVEL